MCVYGSLGVARVFWMVARPVIDGFGWLLDHWQLFANGSG